MCKLQAKLACRCNNLISPFFVFFVEFVSDRKIIKAFCNIIESCFFQNVFTLHDSKTTSIHTRCSASSPCCESVLMLFY